mmetsp:Transcript_27185/g.74519  ORF Transcript_27185/g.74519 Transcript_27185/m.74519 type:complete len:665 (+) Transcript_27185:71-2065(+)
MTARYRAFKDWIVRLQLVISVFCCTRAFFWVAASASFAFVDGKPTYEIGSNTSDSRGLVDANEPFPRIVNGVEVRPMRYPYVAILNQAHVLKCGGVLIAEDIVLTAAHCSESINEVQLGRHNRSDETEAYESLVVETLITHPRYYRNRFLDTDPHDFAVAKLFGRSQTATPIKMNTDPHTPVRDQQLYVFGWGSVDPYDLTAQSDVLLGASAYYLPNEECKTFVGTFGAHEVDYRRYVIDASLCATNFEEGSDSCRGDSGSGLILKGRDPSEDLLVGIVSAGFGCANPTLPAIYARVSEVHGWIREKVCELSAAPPAEFDCPVPDPPLITSAPCDDSSVGQEEPCEPEVTLTISLRLDSRPEEQGWVLRKKNDRGVWATEAERPIFSYNQTHSWSLVTEVVSARKNYDYEFVLFDSFGDIGGVEVTIVDERGNELLSVDPSIAIPAQKRYNMSFGFTVGEPPTSAPTSSGSSSMTTISSYESTPIGSFLSIVILFDAFPENIGFQLEKWNDETTVMAGGEETNGDFELVNAVYPGSFSSDLAEATTTVTIPLQLPRIENETYRFTMTSNEGRGFESGGYKVWLGEPSEGDFLFGGDQFYLEDTNVFYLEPEFIEPFDSNDDISMATHDSLDQPTDASSSKIWSGIVSIFSVLILSLVFCVMQLC